MEGCMGSKYLIDARTYDKTGRLRVISPLELNIIKHIMNNHDEFTYNRLIHECNILNYCSRAGQSVSIMVIGDSVVTMMLTD